MPNVSPDPVTRTTTAIVVSQTSMSFKYMMYLLPLNQNYCTTTENKPFRYHESLRCPSPTPEDSSRAADTRGSSTCCMQTVNARCEPLWGHSGSPTQTPTYQQHQLR